MQPNDFGPIYSETDLSRFPVEPWNTYSNLIFLFIFLYFLRKTRLDYKRHPLIVFSLPILLLGFIGGTLFHATRSHSIWLIMDFVPIFILTMSASLYFWLLLVKNRAIAGVLVLALILIPRSIASLLNFKFSVVISFGYIGLALTIVLPAFIYCLKHAKGMLGYLSAALLFFAVAISFRILDKQMLLPMGTHFLWHLFGGLSAFAMMLVIYKLDKVRASVREV